LHAFGVPGVLTGTVFDLFADVVGNGLDLGGGFSGADDEEVCGRFFNFSEIKRDDVEALLVGNAVNNQVVQRFYIVSLLVRSGKGSGKRFVHAQDLMPGLPTFGGIAFQGTTVNRQFGPFG